MDPQEFRYQPLTEPGAIRLIILQPAESVHEPIACSLVTTTLQACDDDLVDHYCALSYVWGNSNNTRTISVDGSPFEVTCNLDLALRHLRDPLRSRRIWADAICINQHENEEKNKQVSQMGQVYKIARHTIIFLGEATTSTDLVLASARAMQEIASPTVEDWLDILTRPWFSRVWIYQELVLSTDPWIQCGRMLLRWNNFFESMISYKDFHKDVKPWKTIYQMDSVRKDFLLGAKDASVGQALLAILDARRGFGVSDPRDMLFGHRAIVGLSGENQKQNALIEVNYDKPVAVVYEHLARYLFQTIGYRLFSYIETDKVHRIEDKWLASWAPNWTLSSLPYPFRRLGEVFLSIATLSRVDSWYQRAGKPPSGFPSAGIPRHIWVSSSVLACVGYRFTTDHPKTFPNAISKVSPVITKAQASWCVESPMNKSPRTARRLIWEHWKQMIAPLLNGGGRPDYSHGPLFVPNWGSLEEEFLEIRDYEQDPFTKETPESLQIQSLTLHLIYHAISRDGQGYPHFLVGRRFASLPCGSLALVPAMASEGDSIFHIADDMLLPFVLRRIEANPEHSLIESRVRDEMVEPHSDAGVKIKHYEMIGECFAEGDMFKTAHGPRDLPPYEILVIH